MSNEAMEVTDNPLSSVHAMLMATNALEDMAAALDRRPWITKLFSRAGADSMRFAEQLVMRASNEACREMIARVAAERKLSELECELALQDA